MPQKIVVADGRKHVLEKATEILVANGFEVVTVENGNQAKEQALGAKADLILADYLMPEKSGLGMVFDLRQSGNKTPVLIMSESTLLNNDLIIKSGGNGFVKKPLESEALLNSIRSTLSKTL